MSLSRVLQFAGSAFPTTRRKRAPKTVKVQLSQLANDLQILALDRPIAFARLSKLAHYLARGRAGRTHRE